MAEEKLIHEDAPPASGEPHYDQAKDGQISSDAAYGDEDNLEHDEGVSSDEIHPESAEDGVHDSEQLSEHDLEDGAPSEADQIVEQAVDPAPQQVAAAVESPAFSKHWYIIHAYSGFENKVAESLKSRSQAFGFAERLGQILIPTEEVIELRNGKKVTSKRLLYPGYVLVEMEMDDELWHAVKSTPRVTGFVGGGTKPVPLTADEVNAVLYRQASSAERPRPKMTFEKNENVKIVDGPFTNFSGKVDEVNHERNTLRVMVTIFGRSTPVELDFLQVEKV
jgi:transcriptional antiterminator NusG